MIVYLFQIIIYFVLLLAYLVKYMYLFVANKSVLHLLVIIIFIIMLEYLQSCVDETLMLNY